ncbi:MAG: hypothetical protein LN417_10055 [Candidatus Thermoplasmatota archaeon]|nr:hypothetical protein [Candidatus Thermoplasmatota archaeon]
MAERDLSSMSDEEFQQDLRFPDLKKGYQKDVRLLLKGLKRSQAEHREELERELDIAIDDDRYHGQILNACIYPFTQKGKIPKELGYRFVRGSPLEELGVTNVDFLLFKKSERVPVAIIGESKGSVSRASTVVKDLLARRKAALDNIEYMKREYLCTAKDVILECVLGVPASDSHKVVREVIRKGGGLIVWSVSRASSLISVAIPEIDDGDVKMSMMHQDSRLNKLLHEAVTALAHFDVFPQCHRISQLRLLIEHCNLQKIVRPSILSHWLRERDLFYRSPEDNDNLVGDIFDIGVKIGFLRRMEEDEYVIVSRHIHAESLEAELVKKWKDWRIRLREEVEEREKVASLRMEYSEKAKRRPVLPAFDSNLRDKG